MANKIDFNIFLLSCYRALQFNVFPALRFIFVSRDNFGFKLLVYTERCLSETEKELINNIHAEINGDLEVVPSNEPEVKIVSSEVPYEQLEQLDFLIYARYEGF